MSRYAIPDARRFFRALRGLGFKLDYDTSAGGGRTVEWSKIVRDRMIEVQLSDDGKHRATHAVNMGGPHRWRSSTLPTYFTDVDDMLCAVANELMRTDHPPALTVERTDTTQGGKT